MAHTPWRLGTDKRISNGEGLTVADCRYVSDQGKLIVRAVNAFEPMRVALREVAKAFELYKEDKGPLGERIKAALALADKEQP